MAITKIIGDFFLSLWIWQITFALIYPFVTALVMFCLLRFTMKRGRLRSLAISAGAQCASIVALWIISVGVLITMFGWQYEPLGAQQGAAMMGILKPSLMLGAFYMIVQWIWFIVGRLIWEYNLISYLVLVAISNTISSFGSFLIIRMIELSYYIG